MEFMRQISSNKKLLIMGFSVLSVVLVIGVAHSTKYRNGSDIITVKKVVSEQKSNSSLPFLYPKNTTKELRFDRQSLRTSDQLVTYTLQYKDTKLTINIQPKPTGVIFDDFYDRILKNKAEVFNPQGKAVIGIANDKTIGSLVTDKEWVLVNAPLDIDPTVMNKLVGSLQPL